MNGTRNHLRRTLGWILTILVAGPTWDYLDHHPDALTKHANWGNLILFFSIVGVLTLLYVALIALPDGMPTRVACLVLGVMLWYGLVYAYHHGSGLFLGILLGLVLGAGVLYVMTCVVDLGKAKRKLGFK